MTRDEQEAESRKYTCNRFGFLRLSSGAIAVYSLDNMIRREVFAFLAPEDPVGSWLADHLFPKPTPRAEPVLLDLDLDAITKELNLDLDL